MRESPEGEVPIAVNRHDAQAAALQERADTEPLVSALHEGGATDETPENKP